MKRLNGLEHPCRDRTPFGMMDNKELIARLHKWSRDADDSGAAGTATICEQAAQALAAQDARIAELEAERDGARKAMQLLLDDPDIPEATLARVAAGMK